MVTIKEIAETLGLSSSTVSRALRNDETLSIPPETQARILSTADELGYVRPVRSKPGRIEKSILIVHKHQTFRNQIDSSYYFAVRSGIEQICTENHIQCSFIAIEEISNREKNLDGIIIVGNYAKSQYEDLLSLYSGLPVVVIGIVAYFRDRLDHVSYSNFDSVSLGVGHLLEMGHRDIGYVGVEEAPGTEMFGSRKTAFIRVLEENSLKSPWVYEINHGSDRVEQGYQLMLSVIKDVPKLPTAFFCANDPIALGALRAFMENGIQVPEDISIVSHDGSFPTQYSFPPLTTVNVHPFELGMEGTRLLLQKMERKEAITREIFIFPELIVRKSVRKLKQ